MKNKTINETASAGVTGTGSIAVSMGGPANGDPKSLKDFLKGMEIKFVNSQGNYGYKVVPFPITKLKESASGNSFRVLTEAIELQDVLSRLRGMEGKYSNNLNKARDYVTYGVEDDEGNVMKVTVGKDVAAEFEVVLANELAERESDVMGSSQAKISMAELLFNLKDRFRIVDVEFPTIPTDAVYDADRASKGGPESDPTNIQSTDQVPDNGGMDDMGMGGDMDTGMGAGGDMGMGPEGGEDDLPPAASPRNAPMNLDDVEDIDDQSTPGSNLLSQNSGAATGADDMGMGPEASMEDDSDMATEFGDEDDTGSILDKVMKMLTAQAEAQTAQANAEAEKARAEQAKASNEALRATMEKEEQLAGIEAQMERAKEQNKEAKRISDIARFKVDQATGLTEADSLETPAMIRRMIPMVNQRWKVEATDTPEQASFKRQQAALERRELQARLRSAQNRMRFTADQNAKNDQLALNQNQNQQGQPNQQGQQGQQQGMGRPGAPVGPTPPR
jgi:hypothetical protein